MESSSSDVSSSVEPSSQSTQSPISSSSSNDVSSSEEGNGSATIDIYASNDTHGNVIDSDNGLGIAKVGTYLKERKSDNANTIILSSGDMWQGTAESSLTYGNLMTDWMNEIGYASLTYGNHEFDWGTSYIEANAAIADFPFLGINIYDDETGARWANASPSLCLDYGGLTVGIIGAVGDCYSSISSSLVQGLSFKTGDDLTSLVKAEATRLKEEEGADVIIYSLHDGYGSAASGSLSDSAISSYYDVSLSDGYVDLVFEGHTHQKTIYTDSKGVYHLQAGANHAYLSHARLTYDFVSGQLSVDKAEAISLQSLTSLEEDADSLSIIAKYDDILGGIHDKLGTNSSKRTSTYLADLVSKLYLQAGLSKWDDDYDIVLGGGYIKARSPYNLYQGDVTYADLFTLFPFNNDIVLCTATGERISAMSTAKNYHITQSEYGESLSLDSDTRYYIITDTYSLDYAPNGFIYVDTYEAGTYARDLLKDYATSGGFAS